LRSPSHPRFLDRVVGSPPDEEEERTPTVVCGIAPVEFLDSDQCRFDDLGVAFVVLGVPASQISEQAEPELVVPIGEVGDLEVVEHRSHRAH
jgi:hypothetical protein